MGRTGADLRGDLSRRLDGVALNRRRLRFGPQWDRVGVERGDPRSDGGLDADRDVLAGFEIPGSVGPRQDLVGDVDGGASLVEAVGQTDVPPRRDDHLERRRQVAVILDPSEEGGWLEVAAD